jgi:hypothetical protein
VKNVASLWVRIGKLIGKIGAKGILPATFLPFALNAIKKLELMANRCVNLPDGANPLDL